MTSAGAISCALWIRRNLDSDYALLDASVVPTSSTDGERRKKGREMGRTTVESYWFGVHGQGRYAFPALSVPPV